MDSPKIVVCDLHQNFTKEIAVVKDLDVKLVKRLKMATIAFFVLSGFVCLDTVLLVMFFVTKSELLAWALR